MRDPIRVAHVSLGLNVGGMEKLLVEFARHADRERFDLHFVAIQSRGKLADDVEACGWKATCLEKPAGLRPLYVLELARQLRKRRIDLIHTHNTAAYLYGVPAAQLARVRAVIHTRHGQRFGAPARETRTFRLLSRYVDRVVCVSEDSRRLSAGEGIAEEKTCTIWNGIDIERFQYTGSTTAGPAVLVARLSPEKDIACLIRAVQLVIRTHPSFRLEIAGDGQCRPSLQALVSEFGLEQSVRFLGEVRDVPRILQRASMFVLPSLTEGISLTVLEAMASGLPVVATHVGGNPEVVVAGETGLLVPPGSPQELAGAIEELHSDPDRAHKMGFAGRQRVETKFDVRRMVAEYEVLYSCSCRATRRSPPTVQRRQGIFHADELLS